jgi:poly-gamma-glutamate capsule biosynthesis protein CapA/YwtB (metallophosphatase superfamily)
VKTLFKIQFLVFVLFFSGCGTPNQEMQSSVLEQHTIQNPPPSVVKPEQSAPPAQTFSQITPPVAPIVNAKQTISIIGVGDIMLGTNYPSTQYLPRNQGKNLMNEVNHILTDADITFGNLEGTILDKGKTIKNCKNCYAFRMPEFLTDNLITAGFDVMSIANNHVRDFGQTGINNTMRVLEKLGIYAAGIENKLESVTFEKEGVKYGFAAFAPNIGTVKITNIPHAEEIVRQLAKTSDIVIVSFHGGAEGTAHQRVKRKTEIFYGENRGNVHQFSHAVIDAGADIVFGHGPHVTRAVEVYNDRFIAYSLGNFCTYGRFSLRGETKIAPIIKVNVDRQGRFIEAKITPIVQIKNDRVKIDTSKRAISTIQRLTRLDKFDHNIRISNDGLISKK